MCVFGWVGDQEPWTSMIQSSDCFAGTMSSVGDEWERKATDGTNMISSRADKKKARVRLDCSSRRRNTGWFGWGIWCVNIRLQSNSKDGCYQHFHNRMFLLTCNRDWMIINAFVHLILPTCKHPLASTKHNSLNFIIHEWSYFCHTGSLSIKRWTLGRTLEGDNDDDDDDEEEGEGSWTGSFNLTKKMNNTCKSEEIEQLATSVVLFFLCPRLCALRMDWSLQFDVLVKLSREDATASTQLFLLYQIDSMKYWELWSSDTSLLSNGRCFDR